jgi:hypothetical protein
MLSPDTIQPRRESLPQQLGIERLNGLGQPPVGHLWEHLPSLYAG